MSEQNKIKTTEDILTNYTNLEVESGVYVNSALINIFKNINKNLEYVGIDDKDQHMTAVYQYNITDKIPAHIYTNSKHDHLELVHFYDVPDFFDNTYSAALNVLNREMMYSKAVSSLQNLKTIEVSANYFGEFSTRTFLNFLNNFHQDILNFHKINSMFIESWVSEMDKEAKNKDLRAELQEITRSAKNTKPKTKISEVKTATKKLVKPDIVKKSKSSINKK